MSATHADDFDPAVLQAIVAGLRELRFGSLEITVHNARVVQIEKREKVRFDGDPVARDSKNKKDL